MNFQNLAVVFCLLFSFQLIAQESEVAYWSPPDFGLKNSKAIGYETNTFKPPETLENDVKFWVDIYSKYTTHQGVFHLVGATDKILGEIDLTDVYSNQKWSAIRREKEADLIVRIQKRLIAKKFKISSVKMIRLQMGLKDRMREAIKLSGLYLPQIEKIFAEQKLPMELTRLAFVESSFNIFAGSKVGASGLWQIMPNVARKFKYITPTYDKRNHPYYSTLVAAKILKENYQILKSWPLAVTAYNHGVGSLKKIVKKYQSNDIGYLAENVKAKKSFGFASRNFYATFLAALYVEKNANLYFAEPIEKYSELKLKDFTLKKKLKYDDFIQLFGKDVKKMKFANSHIYSKFLKPGRYIPEKTLVCLPSESSGRMAEVLESE